MKETFTLEFKRPQEAVFAALTDFSKLAEMSEGKVRIQPVEGKPASGAGSAVMFKSGQPGIGDVLCETLEWDAPNKVVRKFHLTDMPTTATFEFSDIKGGTKLVFTLELEPKSMMFKMMMPIIEKKIAANKKEAVAKLQQQLDATA